MTVAFAQLTVSQVQATSSAGVPRGTVLAEREREREREDHHSLVSQSTPVTTRFSFISKPQLI